jgi:hypothetical protein
VFLCGLQYSVPGISHNVSYWLQLQTPIENKYLLYESGTKLYYLPDLKFLFENVKETEVSKVQRNLANCSSYFECIQWAKYHKNVSILISELDMATFYARDVLLDENYEPFLCRLEDGVVYNNGLRMLMLQGDPLMRQVTEIIDRVVEADLYDYWISMIMKVIKIVYRETYLLHPLDGYYSFNLYHMQPAFYLLLIGWCLSALCFVVELLYNRVSSKRK